MIGSTSLNRTFFVDLNVESEREHLNSVTLQAGVSYVVVVDLFFCCFKFNVMLLVLNPIMCFRFILCNTSIVLVKNQNVQRTLQ